MPEAGVELGPGSVGADLLASVSSFLAREARLLDERRWDDWLDLWTDDASYSMPTRSAPLPTEPGRPIDDELSPDTGVGWFDDSKDQLAMRIAKLNTGKAWAEEPPSRTRRLVTNIEVGQTAEGYVVRSNVLIYRGRWSGHVDWFSCGRLDLLVGPPTDLRIARRSVVIDADVVVGDNLVLFF